MVLAGSTLAAQARAGNPAPSTRPSSKGSLGREMRWLNRRPVGNRCMELCGIGEGVLITDPVRLCQQSNRCMSHSRVSGFGRDAPQFWGEATSGNLARRGPDWVSWFKRIRDARPMQEDPTGLVPRRPGRSKAP